MIRSKEKYLFIYIYLGKVYIYNNFINNIRQKKIGNIRYRKKKKKIKKKKKQRFIFVLIILFQFIHDKHFFLIIFK